MSPPLADELLDHPALTAFRAIPPARAGIVTDFDGTLSPIVDDPMEAQPVHDAAPTLAALATAYGVVAVVSGRPVHDLAMRLPVPGIRLIGIHGLEDRVGAEVLTPPEADHARAAVERAAVALEEAATKAPGVFVERKGLSVAVHFRRASDPDAAEELLTPIVLAVAATESLTAVPGRRVLEVRPVSGGDKGDALRRLINQHRLEGVFVAGDDEVDLALFRAAASAAVSFKIGIVSAEAPAGLVEVTDAILPGPLELVALLQRLL